MAIRMSAVIVVVMLGAGCAARHGRPIFGGSTIAPPTGTISGTVTSSTGTPLEGRRVRAIETTTEMRYDVTTAKGGGYTIKVPTGRYRLEVELRDGDQLAKQPPETQVTRGDVDDRMDFVVGR
jgi:hypothetical protein